MPGPYARPRSPAHPVHTRWALRRSGEAGPPAPRPSPAIPRRSRAVDGPFGTVLTCSASKDCHRSLLINHGCHAARAGRNTAESDAYVSAGGSAPLLSEGRLFQARCEKVLRQRYEATEGARKLAAESLERAAAKTAEYEAAMRAARAEIYQAQEQAHKQLQEGESAELAAARQRAEAAVAGGQDAARRRRGSSQGRAGAR